MFWVAANLAGLCMGSSQSAGRALVAYLSPAGRSAEFFGLWGWRRGWRRSSARSRTASSRGSRGGNHRLAILLTGVFFVIALVILFCVDERRGRGEVE